MAKKKTTKQNNLLLNVFLVIATLALGVMLYALLMRSFSPKVDPVRSDNPQALLGDIIQVEVRNGCGISGLAAELTDYLRRQGFDVVEVGDYNSFDVEYTMVYDRSGNREAALALARSLGLPEDRVLQELRPEFYLDASVVIGLDYNQYDPFR